MYKDVDETKKCFKSREINWIVRWKERKASRVFQFASSSSLRWFTCILQSDDCDFPGSAYLRLCFSTTNLSSWACKLRQWAHNFTVRYLRFVLSNFLFMIQSFHSQALLPQTLQVRIVRIYEYLNVNFVFQMNECRVKNDSKIIFLFNIAKLKKEIRVLLLRISFCRDFLCYGRESKWLHQEVG